MMNLVTSCRDCNRGKSNRKLDDNSAVKVQRQQLEAMQERRKQLEMMLKWREELEEEENIEIGAIDTIFDTCTKWALSDNGKNGIRKLIRRFGFDEVYQATEMAIDRYYNGSEKSWDNAFNKIGGICYNRKKAKEENAQ